MSAVENPSLTNQNGTVNRGGFDAIGPKVGLLRRTVVLGGVATTIGDVIPVFDFEDRTLLISAGVEIIVPTTNANNVDLGLAGGAEFLGASDSAAAAGTEYVGVYSKAFQLIAAGDSLDLSVSADVGAAGEVEVWALVADVENLTGA